MNVPFLLRNLIVFPSKMYFLNCEDRESSTLFKSVCKTWLSHPLLILNLSLVRLITPLLNDSPLSSSLPYFWVEFCCTCYAVSLYVIILLFSCCFQVLFLCSFIVLISKNFLNMWVHVFHQIWTILPPTHILFLKHFFLSSSILTSSFILRQQLHILGYSILSHRSMI